MKNNNFRLIVTWLFILVSVFSFTVQPTISAISMTALKAIGNETPQHGDDNAGDSNNVCGTDSVDTASSNLKGKDNIEKGYNFFRTKGLAPVQAAAIIGNFRIESSNLDPKADNGSHRGIAQWDYEGRFGNLKKYAAAESLNPDSLSTQLEFAWMEFNGTPPAGDYSEVLAELKKFTEESQIAEATKLIQARYEVVGAATEERLNAARATLKDYGNATVTTASIEDGSSATTVPAVSGSDASCNSVGAVNCSADGSASATGGLSQVRQNVVCLSEQELKKWESGEMGPGGSFKTYSQGRDEEWCADFASWIYNQAEYPIDTKAKDGNVPAKDSIWAAGERGERFEWHKVGSYVPVPGDMVIYDNNSTGKSHVNIVVSVNTNTEMMWTIGGNQGNISTNSQSKVTKYDLNYTGGGDIVGYVSPLDGDSAEI